MHSLQLLPTALITAKAVSANHVNSPTAGHFEVFVRIGYISSSVTGIVIKCRIQH